jgi:diguanylate cyclase (GGDEF)-like protein
MSQESNKNKVFTDYAAIIRGLMPPTQGLLFHNHVGKLFWRDDAVPTEALNDAYKAALQNLLLSRTYDPINCRVMLEQHVAYLLPIINDNADLLGALTVLLPAEAADLPYRDCHAALLPALSSLGRELILRRNLTELKSAASDPESDHRFLRSLPVQARHPDGFEAAIRSLLETTLEQLKLEGVTLLVPERQLRMSVGSQSLSYADGAKLIQQLAGFSGLTEAQLNTAHVRGMEIAGLKAARAWPIINERKQLIGLLVLAWPQTKADSSEKSTSLAGLVATTIELVLERAFDPLTGLLNWPAFEQALAQAYEDEGNDYTLMYFDIDQMQVVNNTFGRATGDEIIAKFGDLLRDKLRGQTLTRITGDGFAALVSGLDLNATAELGKEIGANLRATEYNLDGNTVRPTASIGVADLVRNSDGVKGALIAAQTSCQAAKDRGRNRVEIYQSGDSSIVQRIDDMQMIGSVRSAVEEGRLTLFAQPVVRLDGDSSLSYHEILVRMLDENGYPVEPEEFLGAAERYQLMKELDEWVVTNAVRALKQHQDRPDAEPLRLAINLSGQSIDNEQFLDFLKTELTQPDAPAERICFEVTESIAVQNAEQARAFMEEIAILGAEFALDDFGKGQSSFTYLKMFPIRKLKIDGSFVADITESKVSRAMVKAIVDIARVMEIETVAEFVQDEAVLEAIREIGIDWAQGYLVGAPVELADLLGPQNQKYARTNSSQLPI